jgi:hypothetical protein
MEDSSYLMELLAGVFYTVAAIPLFRLSRRSGERPERVLAYTFLLYGLSYLFYQIPFLPGLADWMTPLSFLGRVCTGAGITAVGLFTWQVFRPEARWARALALGSAIFIALGISMSVLRGDWEGYSALSNPFFWLEWLGEMTPLVWVGVESFLRYAGARRRAHFGLTDPIVANRFFIWGLFGVAQASAMAAMVPMSIEYERYGTFSPLMDSLMGGLEMLSVALVWLTFFPPEFYRRWLRAAAPPAQS